MSYRIQGSIRAVRSVLTHHFKVNFTIIGNSNDKTDSCDRVTIKVARSWCEIVNLEKRKKTCTCFVLFFYFAFVFWFQFSVQHQTCENSLGAASWHARLHKAGGKLRSCRELKQMHGETGANANYWHESELREQSKTHVGKRFTAETNKQAATTRFSEYL